MVKRDFEACSAEGQPRTILGYRSQQIRGALPRGVTRPTSRYPQLCCIFRFIARFFVIAGLDPAIHLLRKTLCEE
jgi:hypothetical protein